MAINVPRKPSALPPPPALPGIEGFPGALALTPIRARWEASAMRSAVETLGELAPGARVNGVTKGQFGLTELLHAVADQIGPAEAVIWTWGIHQDDAKMLAASREAGRFTEVFVVMDRSFPARQPQRCPGLEALLGPASFYCTVTHAKVVLVATATRKVTIQSSMNCNRNQRFEHFDVTDDAALWGHWRALTQFIMDRVEPGLSLHGVQRHDAFKSALGGGVAREAADVDPADIDLDALLADVDLDVPDV